MAETFKRITKSGWQEFSRNMGLSVATISIMVMVILIGTLLTVLQPATKNLVASLQNKMDISVYFKPDTAGGDIMGLKSEIMKIPEVKDVAYISQDDALDNFRNLHSQDGVLMDSLTELGDNPFLASLAIKTWQASQYEQVAKFLDGNSLDGIIEKVDYHERQPIINRVASMITAINNIGLFLSLFFGVIVVLVAFNSVKIAILNSSQEISIMRLVGASNWFTRGPFLIQGVIIGFFSALIAFVITLGLAFGLNSKVRLLAPEVNLVSLFFSSFVLIFLIQLAMGVGLGIFSSYIAVRKHLKI